MDEAKVHLRVTHSDDDAYITGLIKTARLSTEKHCGRAFITQSWEATFDAIESGRLRLPYPPLISITSIHYRDSDGTSQTVQASDYEANTDHEPGIIKFSTTPPYCTSYENPLRVTYVAGYGSALVVPEDIKHAIKLSVGHWYQHRSNVVNAKEITPTELPQGITCLLAPYRFYYS